MLKTLDILHKQKAPVRQSDLSRLVYSVTISDALNGTVRADSSRRNKELITNDLIKEVKPNHYMITSKGVAILLDKPSKQQKRIAPHPFKDKGVRKKKGNK